MSKIRILSNLIIFICLSINLVFSNENKILGKSAAPFSLFKISDDKYYRIKDVIGKKNVVILEPGADHAGKKFLSFKKFQIN